MPQTQSSLLFPTDVQYATGTHKYLAKRPLSTLPIGHRDSVQTPLSPAFVHGWIRLPMELKLHVISFSTCDLANDSESSHAVDITHQDQIKHLVIKYSLASRELGALIQESCYSHNAFKIWTHFQTQRIPPPKFRGLVKRLEIHVGLKKYIKRSFTLLERLESGVYGFEFLKFLKISFRLEGEWLIASEAREALHKVRRFRAKGGEVELLGPGTVAASVEARDWVEKVFNHVQELVRRNITFGMS